MTLKRAIARDGQQSGYTFAMEHIAHGERALCSLWGPVAKLFAAYMRESTYTVGMTLLDSIASTRHPGDNIRERRIELGWSQTDLADASGVTQGDISRIENGHLDARWSTIQRLSSVLSGDHPRRRSLANGGRRNPPPPRTGGGWKPSTPTLPIER